MKQERTGEEKKPAAEHLQSAERLIRGLLMKIEQQQLTEKEAKTVKRLHHEHASSETHNNITRKQLKRAVRRNRQQLRGRGIASSDAAKKRQHKKVFLAGAVTVAATLLLLLSLQLFLNLTHKGTGEMHNNAITTESRYSTTKQMKKILLADGTSVYLNKGSSLLLRKGRFNAFLREVWLEEGEAFFEVAKDPHRPFIVHTPGGISTRVLGTSFNIQAYGALDRQVISVNSGRVQVFNAEKEKIILEPNYKVSISRSDGTLAGDTTQAALLSDWRSGSILFENAPIKEVSLRLKQNYGLELIYKESHFANDLIFSSFRSDTPEKEILSVICRLLNANYTREGTSIYVTKIAKERKTEMEKQPN